MTILAVIFSVLILALAVFAFRNYITGKSNSPVKKPMDSNSVDSGNSKTGINLNALDNSVNQNGPSPKNNSDIFQSPLSRSAERVTKKPFGIYITPQNSPVSPERFQGYHTGTDFEIFPEELNADVPVYAVCSGELLTKESVNGYGGVTVQSCLLDNQPITIIYGHLKLISIDIKVGDKLNAGDKIGILGANNSAETNRERKHLHLGFHKGTAINILGYAQTEVALSDWLDPCLYVCN